MIFGDTGAPENHIVTEASATDEQLIMEGAMLDVLGTEGIQAFLESSTEVQAALTEEIVTEKTIVRLDRNAQISQATKAAIFTIAREKNDPLMKKLMTIWRMERRLEGQLEKKYGNEARRRAKKAVDKRRRSKSSLIRKVSSSPKLMAGKTSAGK